MNKRGFAAAGMLYSLLILFLLLTVTMLNSMQNKKTVLDNLKSETVEALYCTREDCDLLNSYGTATSSDIVSGKTALVKGKKITGTLQKKSASSTTLSSGGSTTYQAGYYPSSWTVSCSKGSTPSIPSETTKKEFVDVTARREKTKVDGSVVNESISNTAWSNCSTHSGKLVHYFSDREDTDTTTWVNTIWSIPMKYSDYINSNKIEITLYAFDKKYNSNGTTSNYYDKSVNEEEYYFRINNKGQRLTITIDRKNNKVTSTVDYDKVQTVVDTTNKSYGTQYIYSKFSEKYNSSTSSLELSYDAYTNKYLAFYSGIKGFNNKTSSGLAQEEKWLASTSSDGYYGLGYDASQQTYYYGKNNTRDEDQYSNASTNLLQTRFNQFAADIKYTLKG